MELLIVSKPNKYINISAPAKKEYYYAAEIIAGLSHFERLLAKTQQFDICQTDI